MDCYIVKEIQKKDVKHKWHVATAQEAAAAKSKQLRKNVPWATVMSDQSAYMHGGRGGLTKPAWLAGLPGFERLLDLFKGVRQLFPYSFPLCLKDRNPLTRPLKRIGNS